MVIETVFNIGDECYFMLANRIAICSISAFYFNSGGMDKDDLERLGVVDSKALARGLGITYKVAVGSERELYVQEHQLFKTREQLIESL